MAKRNRARKRRPTTTVVAVAATPAAQATTRKAAPTGPKQPAQSKRATAPGTKLDRGVYLAAAAAGLVAFVIYALTVEHSVPTGDSGELIAAASVLGIAHPPGYPLYMLLGHIATSLPGGSAALRMNLMSGLLDAIAVSVVFLTVFRLVALTREGVAISGRRWLPYVAAAVGALLLAFSTLFWAYSVVAEVFALNNLLAALMLFVGLEWYRRPQRMYLLWLFTFLLGLAFCNQQTIVLLLPAFAVLAVQGWRRLPRGRSRLRIRLRDFGIAVGALVAGLLPYAYLPLAASASPVMNWGAPSSWGRFKADVIRQNYGTTTLVVGGKKGSVSENLQLLGTNLVHGFVYAGVVLALLGLWWAWRNRRTEGIAVAVAFLVAGPIFQVYTDTGYPDDLTKGIIERFYILPSIPVAIAAGLGAWWVLGQVETLRVFDVNRKLALVVVAAALLVVPAASAVSHYSQDDQSGNHVAANYGHDLLAGLAPNALLLMRNDENYTSVSYAQNVDHFRPDVIALDSELLKLPTYVTQVVKEHPDLLIPFARYDGGQTTSLNKLVTANLRTRPVYFVGTQEEKKFGAPFSKLDAGLVTRLEPKGAGTDQYALLRQDPAAFEQLQYPTRAYPASTWEQTIEASYGTAAFQLAYALDSGKQDVPLVQQLYRKAILLSPTLAAAYKDLGLSLYDHGGDPAEIASVWSTYLRLDPTDPQAGQIRTALAGLQTKQK